MKCSVKSALIIVIFLTGLKVSLFAQSYQHNFDYEFELRPTGEVIGDYDSIYVPTVVITIEDTTTLSEIAVKLGTIQGASDLLQHDFVFDQNTGLPQDCSYERDGNTITLALGSGSAGTFFAELFLRDSSGNTTSALQRSNMPQ